MLSLEFIQPATLLLEYARYQGFQHLNHLTDFVTKLGYVKPTKQHPSGRPVSKHDIRRLLNRLIDAHFPEHAAQRPLSRCHIDLLKAAILARYERGEME